MSKAVQDAQNFIRMYRSFNAMVETLAEFGSVEDALQRATNAKADAQKELEAARGEVSKAKAEVDKFKQEAKGLEKGIADMKRAAEAKRDETIADAKKAANVIIANAQTGAATIIANAQAEADKLSDKAILLRDLAAKAQAEHDTIVGALDALKAKING